jgi:predicted phage terminase large subunit-like protein
MPAGEDQPVIRPQEGPQTAFLATPADIAIYGGAAGGGKSWGLLLEPLRHVHVPGFGAVIFRRTTTQVSNEGGLWDESEKLYPLAGAKAVESRLRWDFPAGPSVKFAHLEHEKTVLDWQGSQIPFIGFDELTHFTAKQFWYLLSRNRSMSGVRPYVRATCNPDADSWVAEFIAWWIDPDTGLPLRERAGVLRWFVRVGETLHWAGSPEDLAHHINPLDGLPIPPKSVTFIPAKLSDNAKLIAADPGYYSTLLALPLVERERLLGGNWKIRPAAGLYFQRSWVTVKDVAPANMQQVRGWDLAATPKTEDNDPDWTCGTLMAKDGLGNYWVLDHVFTRDTPSKVEKLIKSTADSDRKGTRVSVPQDPGQAGKGQVQNLTKLLVGHPVSSSTETGDKLTRFSAFSAQAEAGNIYVLKGTWNERWFDALEGFPEAAHDDDADSTSRAFNTLLTAPASIIYDDVREDRNPDDPPDMRARRERESAW